MKRRKQRCPNFITVPVIKSPDPKQPRGGRLFLAHSSRLYCITKGTSRQQNSNSHIRSKQAFMLQLSCLCLLFCSSGPREWYLTHLGWVFLKLRESLSTHDNNPIWSRATLMEILLMSPHFNQKPCLPEDQLTVACLQTLSSLSVPLDTIPQASL